MRDSHPKSFFTNPLAFVKGFLIYYALVRPRAGSSLKTGSLEIKENCNSYTRHKRGQTISC